MIDMSFESRPSTICFDNSKARQRAGSIKMHFARSPLASQFAISHQSPIADFSAAMRPGPYETVAYTSRRRYEDQLVNKTP